MARRYGNEFVAMLGREPLRGGWPIAGETLKSVSFFFAFLLSMPFWLMKGQPWKAQAVIIGVTLALLLGANYVAWLL